MKFQLNRVLALLVIMLFMYPPSAQAAGGVKAPSASVKAGTYTASKTVIFSCKTKGTKLYYTTDGATPTAKSKKYTGKKLTVSKTTTFKVVAVKGKKKSKVLTAVYTILTEPKLKTVENAANGVSVKWSAVSGAEGYLVYRKESGGKWRALAKTKAVSYVDKTAQAGKNYSYSVSAYKGKTYGKYNTKGISCTAAHIHSYSQWNTVEPTCTENGEKAKTCQTCGKKESHSLSATGHKWDESIVTAPSCTEDGLKNRVCSVCGVSESAVSVPAIGHKWGKTTTIAATCERDGSQAKTCLNCGKVDTTILPAEHEYEYKIIYDDALKNGYYDWEFCKWCGKEKTYTFDEVELYYYEDLSHQLFNELLDYRQEYYESVGGKGERRKIEWNEGCSQRARLQAAYNALCVCMNRDAYRESKIYGGEWNPACHSSAMDGSAATYYRTASEILQSWKNSIAHNNDILALSSGTRKFTGMTYDSEEDVKRGAISIVSCKVGYRTYWVAIYTTAASVISYDGSGTGHVSESINTFIIQSPDGQRIYEPLETYATREQMLNCPKTTSTYPFKN